MQQTPSVGIVFISGAGLGAWIWNDVSSQLPYPATVIDFEELKKSSKNASLAEYTAEALSQIEKLAADHIVIVAHSVGGCVGTEVVHQLGKKAAGFIAISAALPEKGKSFLSVLPFPQSFITGLILRIAGTKPPESAIRAGLCNDIDEAVASKVVSSFSPESIRLYTDPVPVSAPSLPSAYVLTANDAEFPLALQQKMARRLNDPVITQIKSGHLPMLTHVDAITAAITAFVQEEAKL